jgi:hypothetical protein
VMEYCLRKGGETRGEQDRPAARKADHLDGWCS